MKRVANTKRMTLRDFIRDHVRRDAEGLITDDFVAYKTLGKDYRHSTINHSKGDWVCGDVHTNGIENAWSLFKRCVVGAYQKISHKHLTFTLTSLNSVSTTAITLTSSVTRLRNY